MSTATRTPVRIPSIEPAAMSSVRRVITAKTSGRVQRRVAWFTGALTATSLLAACGSEVPHDQGAGERRSEEHGKRGRGRLVQPVGPRCTHPGQARLPSAS